MPDAESRTERVAAAILCTLVPVICAPVGMWMDWRYRQWLKNGLDGEDD